MRNLKRVLSLVLASIMLIGMMVVGAGAVDTYNDFSDKDEIVNKDAVSLLVTLDVINGKEDGSYFDPTGDVTRAEMAKMISVILNRGADINNQYATLNNGLTDIANNWAVGHINYCYSLDIIAGRGDGRFDPTANVTAVEAAKMLLSAAGYDASIEGMVGPNWDTNTAGLASRLGIFENFEKDITQPLNRDDAALLIYNFLDIEMIQSYENGYAIAFGDSRTVLSFAYGVIKVQGVVVANEWATVNSKDGDDAMKAGTTTLYNRDGIFSTTTNTQTNGGNTGLTTAERALRTGTFKVSTPEDYLGKSVTLYIRKTTILADSIVYGTPVLTDDNVVVTTGSRVNNGSRTSSGSLLKLVSDNNLNLGDDTRYFHNYDEYSTSDSFFTSTLNSLYNVKGATLTVIDNDADGIADYVLSKEKTLSQVSAYSTKNETLNLRGINGSIDFDKIMGYEDVEKEDIVFFVQYGGRTYVEKPQTVRGEMDLYNVKGDNKYIRVEGENYEQDGLTVVRNTDASKFYVDGCESSTDWDGNKPGTDITGVDFDNTYDFYLDDYGHVTGFQLAEGSASKYALVLGSAFSTNGLRTDADVKVLLSDGTSGTYSVDWDASVKSLKNWMNDNNISSYGSGASANEIKTTDGTTIIATKANNAAKWTDSDAAEVMKYLLGTNDGRQGSTEKYPAAGAFLGNVIKYSLNDKNVITISLADLAIRDQDDNSGTDNDRYVGPASMVVVGWDGKTLGENVATGIIEGQSTDINHSLLATDLEKGDVDLYIDVNGLGSGETVANGDLAVNAGAGRVEFGIDDDTIIFYYNKNGSAVRIGYSEMARKIDKGTAVSVIGYKNATDVAEVIVLYPTTMQFGDKTYVYVLKTFDVVNGEYRFNLVNTDGTISHDVKSKDKDVADALRTLTRDNTTADTTKHDDRDGIICEVTYDSDGYASFDMPIEYDTPDHVVVYGIARFTGSSTKNYVNVYDDFSVDKNGVVTIESTASTDFIRLSHRNKDVVYDLTDTSWKDDNAAGGSLENWQRVAVVYDNETKTIKAAFIEEYYKNVADTDDDFDNDSEVLDTAITDVNEDDLIIYITAAESANDRRAKALNWLERNGYVVTGQRTSGRELIFDVKDRSDNPLTFNTKTTWMSETVVGAQVLPSGAQQSDRDSLSNGTVVTSNSKSDLNAIGITDTPNNRDQIIVFAFKVTEDTNARLVVKKADGTTVYDEYSTSAFTANTGNVTKAFYINADGTDLSQTAANKPTNSGPLATGRYTWTITKCTDVNGTVATGSNALIASGEFTIQ